MIPILVIDDDIELCTLLTDYLGSEGFTVEAVQKSKDGIKQALSGLHNLVVLDVMLPEISGFEVLRSIRSQSSIPIIMLTARGDDIDRIVGLEMGADDYLPKPFNPRELVARLKAIHRRLGEHPGYCHYGTADEVITVGDLSLDPRTREVKKDGQRVTVTSVEFSLLQELLRCVGQVASRELLSERVLGRRLATFDRSIDVHVASLRRKLCPQHAGIERIKAIRGVGYIYTNYESEGGTGDDT